MADMFGAREPVFGALPAVVFWLCGAIALVSGLSMLVGPPARDLLQSATAVVSGPRPDYRPFGEAAPYVLHVFAHGSWAHLGLNLLALLAFGGGVARRFGYGFAGAVAFLGFFFLCAVGGAAAELAWQGLTRTDGRPAWMVGASTGVSGLIAGAVYVMRGGMYRSLPPVWSATYLAALAPWVVINVLIGVAGGFEPSLEPIAWAAHLGGLAAGALSFPLIDAWAQRHRPWAP